MTSKGVYVDQFRGNELAKLNISKYTEKFEFEK